ncbi:MAG: flavodoxin-dependent (E)-4-hydroxy-3-methylbut-2-enyl-diphosphate synthase, partial [Syntrophales bacterium]|nr:flavodoxin-dependent (E)-4-hydroxy-3-methylbut-2-enyl-diphosphate synthase [Syntrophales bacterium]
MGNLSIGGDAPVIVQSMTTTDTRDVKGTVRQIRRLVQAGCEAVRVAVPDEDAARVLGAIKARIPLPLVADIHFRAQLALMALDQGVDGIRINPGNMPAEKVREIVKHAAPGQAVIRVGVNAGSLEKDLFVRYGGPTAEALCASAVRHLRRIEDMGFDRLKVSVKSSHVPIMIKAYRLLSAAVDYPLHLGVTEAGGLIASAVKSSIGIGALLYDGIGDTIRVSVTGDPVQEIPLAYAILRALNIRKVGVDIISCPTCGRCEIDVAGLVRDVERRFRNDKRYLKIAVMGCVVNGPGEAAGADVGIAGGRRFGLLFRKGEVVRKVREAELVDALMEEIGVMLAENDDHSSELNELAFRDSLIRNFPIPETGTYTIEVRGFQD